MKEQELKELCFKFYDELPEPYRTQAKNNWNAIFCAKHHDEFGDIMDLEDAIIYGFDWEESPEDYWCDVSEGNFKKETKGEYWQKVMFAGQQIAILQDMRDTGMMTVKEFKEEVNKILDAVN